MAKKETVKEYTEHEILLIISIERVYHDFVRNHFKDSRMTEESWKVEFKKFGLIL